MARIAIVTDSNSGITQAEGKKLGVYVLPMPFDIDGQPYFEDINLTQEQFYEKLTGDADVSTSQPSPDAVMSLWDDLLKNKGYDEIVHIPMSSGLSSSCATAMMLAQDYDGKVQVVDNQRISVTMKLSVLDAMKMTEDGFSAAEIKRILEEQKFNSSIYIMVDTLKYLKKGGRITPAAAALGTLLRLKPVLQIQGEKLDAFAKARTVKQAKRIMLDAIHKDIETRMGGEVNMDNLHIAAAYTPGEGVEQWLEEIRRAFPDKEIIVESAFIKYILSYSDRRAGCNSDKEDGILEMRTYTHVVHDLTPVYDEHSRILILGSLPSVKSRGQFFYNHPQNRFWKVLAAVTDHAPLENVEEKKQFLLEHQIALWDVIASCDIIGSSDSSIKNVVANDIGRVLSEAPIRQIFVNGQTAFKLYKKYVLPETGVMPVCLPSTSPANAVWNMERLTEAWQVIVRES